MWFSVLVCVVVECLIAVQTASTRRRQTIPDNGFPPSLTDSTCGDIVDIDGIAEYGPWFLAVEVYDCITSVPFNDAVATRFIKYYNETLQFHTTIELLKSPPSSYKQPAVDIIGRLGEIQAKVDAKAYHNQYAFEEELQRLVLDAHDAHLTLYAGVLNQFTFGSLYDIVTLSEDGIKTPEVYVWDDWLEHCAAQPGCVPSPIDTINGIATVDFLTDFAKNQSIGLVESHADWNQLMLSPALNIQGGLATFGGNAQLYPGDELNITLKNGSTDYDFYWISLYNSPGYTGPLDTGGDFYNFFVLGNIPPSFNTTPEYREYIQQENNISNTLDNEDNVSNNNGTWYKISKAYPNVTLVSEKDLGLYGLGVVTGYLLDDISAAVLSLPSFESDFGTFSQAITKFVGIAHNKATRVVIDLQQNSGGDVSLALWTFAQFFPGVYPFAGSRMRAHSSANILGQTYNNELGNRSSGLSYADFLVSEWVVTDRINAETGQNFSSWAEFFGHLPESNDFFTRAQEYNLSSPLFDYWNLNAYPEFADAFATPHNQAPPWSPANIVLLTDGLCSSACTLFLELMKQQSGVRTVVVGGRPEPGPMQAASGTRGAASYSGDYIDADIDQVIEWNPAAQSQLPVRGNATDTGMLVTYAGINLRDQIRKAASSPNQLLYLPADCRIYWTFSNFNNYTRLWQDAWTAIYNDTSLCVPGSTGIAESNGFSRRDVPRKTTSDTYGLSEAILDGIGAYPGLVNGAGVSDAFDTGSRGFPRKCGNSTPDTTPCPFHTQCLPVTNECGRQCSGTSARTCKQRSALYEHRCLEVFHGTPHCSSSLCTPRVATSRDSNINASGRRSIGERSRVASSGYCYPKETSYNTITCTALENIWNQDSQK